MSKYFIFITYGVYTEWCKCRLELNVLIKGMPCQTPFAPPGIGTIPPQDSNTLRASSFKLYIGGGRIKIFGWMVRTVLMKQLHKSISDCVLLTVLCVPVSPLQKFACLRDISRCRQVDTERAALIAHSVIHISSELASNSYCHRCTTAPLCFRTFNKLHCGIAWLLLPSEVQKGFVPLCSSIVVMYSWSTCFEQTDALTNSSTSPSEDAQELNDSNLPIPYPLANIWPSPYPIACDKTSDNETALLST